MIKTVTLPRFLFAHQDENGKWLKCCYCPWDQVPLRGPDPHCTDCGGTGEIAMTEEEVAEHLDRRKRASVDDFQQTVQQAVDGGRAPALAAQFEVATSTVKRWAAGVAKPLRRMRRYWSISKEDTDNAARRSRPRTAPQRSS